MTEPLECPSQQRRAVLFAFGCLQSGLVAGILFGWASIAGTLLVAPLDKGGAGLTMEETTIIYGMAASTGFFASLLLGYVLDVCGPRICSVVSNVFIALGCQIFSMARTFPHFALGACMIAFGGPGIQSSVVHIGNLFPGSRFLVMSCLGGSVAIGFNVLPAFGALWALYGIGLQPMFATYMFVVLLSTVGSLLLWPDEAFELEERYDELELKSNGSYQPTPAKEVFLAASHTHLLEAPIDSYLRSNSRHQLDRNDSFMASKEALEVGMLELVNIKDLPFCQQLFSWMYLRILLVFIATSFLANFVVASLTTELADQNYFPTNVQHDMARTFTLVCSFGILGSIFIGWLMDRTGLETCTALTLVMGSSQSLILTLFSDKSYMMMLGFVMYSFFRQFLFPVFVAGLSAKMGFKYYGILSGIGFALSGLSQLYIATVVEAIEGSCHEYILDDEEPCTQGSWKVLHMIQCIVLLLLLGIPAYDRWWNVQSEPRLRKRVDLTNQQLTESSQLYGALEGIVEVDTLVEGGISL